MIARIWHGVTPVARGDAYFDYLMESGIRAYQSIEGNRGVYVLRGDRGSRTDFLLISLWGSYDAIRKFAGPEYERAVYYPRDKEFLVEFEPSVVHYEVLLAPEPAK